MQAILNACYSFKLMWGAGSKYLIVNSSRHINYKTFTKKAFIIFVAIRFDTKMKNINKFKAHTLFKMAWE